MGLFARLLAGVLAAYIAWTIVRGLRKGELISNFRGYSFDDNPIIYMLALIVRIGMLGFFILLSAGFTIGDISRLMGLNSLAP